LLIISKIRYYRKYETYEKKDIYYGKIHIVYGIKVSNKESEELKMTPKKYEIVVLCGSTKFKDDFIKIQKELTLLGKIVIPIAIFGHSGDKEYLTEDVKSMLVDMQKFKIDMADSVFIINKDGYIGNNTQNEIKYAMKQGKRVNYMQ